MLLNQEKKLILKFHCSEVLPMVNSIYRVVRLVINRRGA